MSFRGKSDSPTPIYRNVQKILWCMLSDEVRARQTWFIFEAAFLFCSLVQVSFRWSSTEARWSYQLMYIWVLAPGNTHLNWEWDYLEKELTPRWRVGCLVSALSQFFIFFRLSASPSLEEWATQWALCLPLFSLQLIACAFFLFSSFLVFDMSSNCWERWQLWNEDRAWRHLKKYM